MVEAFRGDVLVWLRIARRHASCVAMRRDASWFQWPLLEAAIENNIVADFPLCNKSFNCSLRGARPLMRTLLLRSLFSRPVTVEAPKGAAAIARRRDAGRSWARRLGSQARRLFGRSITIREVDAGLLQRLRAGNPCAQQRAVYDVERFGIKFAASPRHADVLLVTGPVTHNMGAALERTYAATPDPKWVVAVGDCAAGCGVFGANYATSARVLRCGPPVPSLEMKAAGQGRRPPRAD